MINEHEVVLLAPVKREFPKEQILKHLDRRVKLLFINNECLKNLLPVLNEDLIDYSDVECWDKTETYDVGDNVEYNGIIYSSLKDDNTETPNNYSWKVANKFTTSILQQLWDECLGVLMACYVILPAITLTTYSLGKSGATKFGEDAAQNKGVEMKELGVVVSMFQDIVNENFIIFENFVSTSTESVFKECNNQCNDTEYTIPKNRRIMMR